MKSLVSVIIPCYNSEEFIEETIQSITNQTHQEIEIICVDNNSTDGTLSKLKDLSDKSPKIQVLSEPEPGASYARNKGLSVAQGEFIQFLDSDDLILPQKFENQIKHIRENELDWVISDRKILNNDLSLIVEEHKYSHFMSDPLAVAIAEVITSGNPLYKRSAVLAVQGYTAHLKVGQDWDFHLKLILAQTKFGYVSGDYFHSRQVQNSLSSNWFKVSYLVSKLIQDYKEDFLKYKAQDKLSTYEKIFRVYFSTSLYVKGNQEIARCLSQIEFWSSKFKPTDVLTGKNKVLAKLIGINGLIKLRRLFHTKLDH